MRRFANLYDALDSTTSTLAKVRAMVRYFGEAPPRDAAWALHFLLGRRLKRLIAPSLLVQWTYQQNGLPEWMVEECYALVGDLAETTALLLDTGVWAEKGEELALADWIEGRLLPLKGLDAEVQRDRIVGWWRSIPRREVFLLNKLLTGELRVGVSDTLVLRALGEHSGLPPATLAHRVMGPWEPSAERFLALIHPEGGAQAQSQPYPFCLAYPLEVEPETLGEVRAWLAEWKWDGIRCQLIRRGGQVYLWSRGEELITDRFPEVRDAAMGLPDGTVLDGEVLAFERGSADGEGRPLPFAMLQRRIGRQKLTAKVLKEAPAHFMAYDLLEHQGKDWRERPLAERRARLSETLHGFNPTFSISRAVEANDWVGLAKARARAREHAVEGLMLKRLDSAYRAGRKKGDWWKWKIDPYSVDAVMIYAHPGNGRRANLFTDYTFGVWKGDELVPVAKAYSGLTDAEVDQVDAWVRAHTLERFGPVRVVEPSQVFELHFEAIAPSSRHKSGVAVRFPRISRWRLDKPAAEADSIETLQALLTVPTLGRKGEDDMSGRNPEMPNREVDDEAVRQKVATQQQEKKELKGSMPGKTPGSAEGPLDAVPEGSQRH